MVKTRWRLDHSWFAIFSIIIYFVLVLICLKADEPYPARVFWSFSAPGGSLVPFIIFYSLLFFYPTSIKLTLGTSICMSKTTHTQKIVELFLEMTSQWRQFRFCNVFVSCPILFKFCTEMLLGITNKNTKFCWDWLQNDVTVTSSMIWRTRFCLSTYKRMCCHFNIKHFFLLKFCTDWLRDNVTVMLSMSWVVPFRKSAVSRVCCHGNMNTPFLLKFGTKVQLGTSNKIN